jgi:hypothetical protein
MTTSLSSAFAAATEMHFFRLHVTAMHVPAMHVPAMHVPAMLVPAMHVPALAMHVPALATLVSASSSSRVIRTFTALCFFHRCRVAHLYIIKVNYFCKKLI